MKRLLLSAICLLPVLMEAGAQTNINSSFFQVMYARALGPSTMSGRITAIEGITVDKQVNLYVGTAGGGIWKSQNGGQSFTPIFDNIVSPSALLLSSPAMAK